MTDATSDIVSFALPRRELLRRLVIGLSLALVLAAAVGSLFMVQGVDSQMRDVQHSYEVRSRAQALEQRLVDAETGQRGYLLTQDQAYLDPYRDSVASLDATYKDLLALVEASPSQKMRVTSLSEPIEQKRAEMATTITMVTDGRLNEALTILRSDAGWALMAGIRQTLAAFIAEEDERLAARNALVENSRLWLFATILLALGGAAILTYSLFSRTQRQVSSLARTSSELMTQKEELEARVRERTAELDEAREHAERERARVEALLQETNHRIGNSLATVSSLLGLQVTRTRSAEVRTALEAAQSRVHAIASGHRRLRLGDDLETTNAAEFLEAVIEDLESTQSEGRKIGFATAVEPLVINARDATTIGIIVGELVINALKHAFPEGASGTIWTGLRRDADGAILMVEDDGRGLPAEQSGEGGLGHMIIRQLALQFGGEPTYEARQESGTRVTVRLPKLRISDGA
jgi:two-component sensor histidine kinase/CHASE3 domain sensor protein